MKRFILFFTLFLCYSSNQAQHKFGAVGGIHATTFSQGFLKSFGFHSNSFTFHLGGVYENQITDHIAFRPKLLYSQQGDLEDFDDKIQYETAYINVPVNFKFFSRPYLLAGPQFGFLIDTQKNAGDFGDLEKLDYGANLGIGYDISDFFIELVAYQGLNNLIEVNFHGRTYHLTNTTIGISLGYFF